MKRLIFVLAILVSAVTPKTVPSSAEYKPEFKPISEEVYFQHYSRERPNQPTQLKTEESLHSSINPKLPWKFFVHGFTTSPSVSPWFHTGKAAYFHKGKYNVVFVDWSKPANQSYIESVMNAMEVGKFFGKFIIHLNENGVSLDDIHLLGHSLGSHMVGFTGKYVRDHLAKIGRITGLDPAGPFYETDPLLHARTLEQLKPRALDKLKTVNPCLVQDNKFLLPEHLRLSENDANFVDIIHTDYGHFGIEASIGHIDFYPNGGKPFQPGCKPNNDKDDNCSHAKSVEYFVESINLNNFVARECDRYKEYKRGDCKFNKMAMMGEHTDHKARGIFYLKTNPSPPYGQGHLI